MSIFTESEKNFLSSLGDTDIFIESSKSDRVKVLNKTIEVLESLGFNPKISKPSRVGWINENNSGDFEESLCISLGKLQGLESVCTKVNKEIKPLGGKVSPDNYGTIFLSMKDNVVTESYIGNYFRNKVLLHKLGKNPELNERTIIKFIKNLTLKYEESLLDEDVQKIMKKRDVADYFVPQAELNFPDGMIITFAFCYDKKSLTPGAAFKNDNKDYIVLLYPCFFDCRDMDVNVFTIMHEIGHIRLGHCELKNRSLDPQRRQKVMVKGGVIYTELNADLYASLNGAKMYTILKEGIDKDYDKNYDYRYTNNELSKRYSFVLKNYQKLRPMTESLENTVCEYMAESLKSDYRYENINSINEISDFLKVMKDVFDEDSDMSESAIKKSMKSIYFKNKLIGYVGFSEYNIKGKKYLGIGNFIILPKYQRQGYGTDVIEDIIRTNKDNYDEIYCYVDKDNKKAIRFYDKIAKINKKHLNENGYFYVSLYKESVEDIHDNWCYITESDDKKRTAKTGEFEIEKVEFKVYNDRDYSYVTVKGIDKPLRGRSEVIIMKDDEVYLCFDNDRYRLPGGGWDKGESYEHAALRETKEEAKINCTNIKYCTSRVDVSDGVPDKCKKENIPEEGYWYGYFTKVFIAEYDKKFSGHVDKEDQDPSMVKTGKFYPFEEIKDQLYSEHKEAIEKYLGVSDEVFKEDALDDDAFDMIDVMLEAASDSHIIKDVLYPPIEAVLKTRDGDKLFKRYVEEFIDRNTEKLHEPCPISLIPFTDNDKARFFSLFNLNEKECIKVIGQAADAVSSSANFRLVKQNPIFCVFYLVLRYYIINKDESGINSTLAIHALASYPSVFSKYFKYGANPGIMRYTADHLTEKFIFKQEGHVFGALRKSIEASYKFLKPYFDEATDKEMIRYIQRIRNDQNSLIKKIANEYQKNYKAGKSVSTQNETYDTGALIDDYNNDTSKAETASHSIIISLLTNGIDLRILETASEIAQLSISELRLYLVKILVDSRSTEIEDFISAVLFIYLYDEKHTMDEIKSKQFLSFGISLFRKTNSNDKNIATIKKTLDKWAEETGIHNRYKREPTRIAYKKGIYWYILLTIQSNL